MSTVFVCGIGVVSPAGWDVTAFREALAKSAAIATRELPRPGDKPLAVRQVPPPPARPPFLAHARLRRTSPIAHYTVSAALQALGEDLAKVTSGQLRLGIVYCALSGCVNYSRRFYDEVLKDPSTASPLVFPETVYNSPASHLAALVGTTAINYTLVGDPGTFVQGLALAADWLAENRVDGCLVIGTEEMDWLTAGAIHLLEPQAVFSDGAGVLYLRRQPEQTPMAQLVSISDPCLFTRTQNRAQAIQRARSQVKLPTGRALLCDGLQGFHRADRAEQASWADWGGSRLSVKTILGEGLMAAAAWQCVAAVDAIAQNAQDTATVSVAGTNEQAIVAQFSRPGS